MQSAGTESVRTCTPLLSQAGRVGFGNGAQQPWESCRGLRGAQPGGRCLICLRKEKTGRQSSIWRMLPSPQGGFGAAALIREKEQGAKAGLIKVCHAGLWLFAVLPLLMILPQHLLGFGLLLLILAAPCRGGRALWAQGWSSTVMEAKVLLPVHGIVWETICCWLLCFPLLSPWCKQIFLPGVIGYSKHYLLCREQLRSSKPPTFPSLLPSKMPSGPFLLRMRSRRRSEHFW